MTTYGELNNLGREEFKSPQVVSELEGGIYAEEWDLKQIEETVVEGLKDFYLEFERRVAKRREDIAAEEEQPAK